MKRDSAGSPLKSDINVDLKERGPISNPLAVDDVLYFYTNDIGYHHAAKAGAGRVDLDGKVVAKVTEAEQREAEQRIADIRVMMEERKKQQANDDDNFVEEKRRAVIPRPSFLLTSKRFSPGSRTLS